MDSQASDPQDEARRRVLESDIGRALMEAAPDGILVVSDTGEVLAFNRRFVEMWQIPADVIATRSDEAALRAVLDALVDPAAFLARVSYVYGHPEERSLDEIHLKDGRTFDRHSAPLKGPAGESWGRIWFFRDVTPRKLTEEVLHRREQEFKALVENTPDIIARFDRGFRHVYVNQAVERSSGASRDAFLGRTNREVGMPPDLCVQWETGLRKVFETGREETIEFTFTGPQGPIHFQSRVVPEFDRQGSVVSVLGVTRDITARKRLESELREQLHRLAEADRRKNEFLAMLAHELRNPLAPIVNALYVLKEPGVDRPTIDRVRDVMERQVINLTRLVDDLLDVSRITRGKIQLRREVTDASLVVKRAVEAVRPLVDERRHQLTVSLPAAPVVLDADPTRLEQILTNLLNNAAKYTEPGGRIDIVCERSGDEAVIRVRDSGMGIAPDVLPRIFDLFVQVEGAPGRAHGGLGIGLTLVRSLVEMHGGSVQAHSEGPARGSEFAVRLPLTDAAVAAADGGNGDRASGAGARRRRVLVVDDNVDAAESLALMLQLMGQDVRVAHDGPSALEAARTARPEIILLDIGLPGMSGYEVARRLRDESHLPPLVLAALTGWGQEEDRRRSKEAGFDHHLVKPIGPEALGRLLAQADRRSGPGRPDA